MSVVDTADGAEELMATATINISLQGDPCEMTIRVPAGPTTRGRLLPVVRALTDALVGVGVDRATRRGEAITCRKGCGACCRQLVPISETEARRLREVVDAMPAERRAAVRQRYAEAHERLDRAGLLALLLDRDNLEEEAARKLGLDYFHAGVSCPFLEDEACSIYEERPLACREYLVTTPAVNCARPTADNVRCVELPGKASIALDRLDEPPEKRLVTWVPLGIALEWAETHPDELPRRPGPDLLRELFHHLQRTIPQSNAAEPPVPDPSR